MQERTSSMYSTLLFLALRLSRLSLIMLLGTGFAIPVTATEIHRWTDENGNTHFGDQPPASAESEILTVTPNVYKSPIVIPNTAIAPSTSVVLYSAQWCGYCRKARAYFQANRIPFKEYDVEKSRKGKQDYRQLGARGVPVILVGSQRMNGFSEASFRDPYDRNVTGS